MRILIIDDNEFNQKAARSQLGADHKLTIVSTYAEAEELLRPKINYDEINRTMYEAFGNFGLFQLDDKEKSAEYLKTYKVAQEGTKIYPNFDVVLTELFLPGLKQKKFGDKTPTTEKMSIGIFIGLMAALVAGVRYVAVVTDMNHHLHQASKCLDAFNERGNPTLYRIGGQR